MTKISQLSSIGDSLAIDDQFLIRDVDDGTTPNKSVTVSGIARALPLGTALAPALAFAGDKNTGIYSPGADQVAISTGGTQRVTIDSSGRVGLGTSSPSSQLHCTGDIKFGDAITLSRDTSTGLVTIADGTPEPYTQGFAFRTNETDEAYRFQNGDGASTYLTIRGSGNVGIGTASPGDLLTIGADNPYMRFADTNQGGYSRIGSINGSIDIDADAGNSGILPIIQFKIGGSEKFRIDSSGRLLVGTATSRDKWFNTAAWGNPTFQLETAASVTSVASIVNNANDDGPGALFLAKSRAGSVGGVTVVSNNDVIGRISFQGADGTEMVAAAMIEAQVDGTPGADDMPGRLVFSTTADGASSPTERMRIRSTGWVDTFSSSTDTLVARSSSAAGTTNFIIRGTNSATNTADGSVSFQVATNGNVTNTNNSYGAISDVKLKENIVDANSQWDDIKALQVRNYNFKEGQTHAQIGLIAQEVEPISPSLVSESPDRDEDGNDLGTVTKSVKYSVLYMKAVKALQEAMERIETLEARVAALEGT